MKSEKMLESFSSVMKHHPHADNMFSPTLFLMQKMFCLDFIMHSLSFGTFKTDFFAISDKFKLILELFETQVTIDATCERDHPIKPLVYKLFRIFVNIFLARLTDFKNDYIGKDSSRKLEVFNCTNQDIGRE